MKLLSTLALVGLLAACAAQPPDPNAHAATVHEVQPAGFHSVHTMYFQTVDDGSTYMQQLVEHVPVEPPDRITAEVDRWRTGDRTFVDHYLVARSPEAIESWLAREPSLEVPHDRQLAFEQLGRDRWRTYLVSRTVELDGASIADATAERDPNTDRPVVLLDLTPAAAMHFAELTARIAGHKLAVTLDGNVIEAPIVTEAITGGRVAISLGNGATDLEAQALATQLVR